MIHGNEHAERGKLDARDSEFSAPARPSFLTTSRSIVFADQLNLRPKVVLSSFQTPLHPISYYQAHLQINIKGTQ